MQRLDMSGVLVIAPLFGYKPIFGDQWALDGFPMDLGV
jgi:hypothetical protein